MRQDSRPERALRRHRRDRLSSERDCQWAKRRHLSKKRTTSEELLSASRLVKFFLFDRLYKNLCEPKYFSNQPSRKYLSDRESAMSRMQVSTGASWISVCFLILASFRCFKCSPFPYDVTHGFNGFLGGQLLESSLNSERTSIGEGAYEREGDHHDSASIKMPSIILM